MAVVVERPAVMIHLEDRLMAGARIHLPPLPPNHSQPNLSAAGLSNESRPAVRQRSPIEDSNPRPRKSLAYNAGPPSDMETYHGHVRTPADAIILFEACRIGLLPRVQRRLSEKERQSIKSGSVFVWDEREAGMRRWTDGKSWSASRVSGSFLTYREMEGKRGGGGGNGYPPPVAALSRAGRTPDSTHGSESEIDVASEEGPDGYRYKPDGLVKQSFSITTSSGNHLHLISYYSRAHPASQQLNNPSTDASLRQIRPAKGMYPESTVQEQQNIPAVTRSPMAGGPYTTTPQMAGYARQGPPQWQQQPYWGSSSPSQPPYQYYGYPYPPGPGPAPPSGPPPPFANGHPSGAYPQPPLQSPSHPPPDRPYPGYDSHPPQPHDYPGYDSRRPPPQSPGHQPLAPHNPSSPSTHARPPPTYPHPNVHPNAPREPYPSGPGDPARTHESPRSHDQPGTQGHSLPSHGSAAQPGSLPPPGFSQGLLPPPNGRRSPQGPYTPSHTRHSPSTPIDPQLMGSASGPASRSAQPADQRGPAPQPSPHNPSSASTIPSIGALVNGSTSQPQQPPAPSQPAPTNHLRNGFSSYPSSSDTRNPPGSGARNPPESNKARDGVQDFAGGQVGFGEDSRTKGLLDKGFKV